MCAICACNLTSDIWLLAQCSKFRNLWHPLGNEIKGFLLQSIFLVNTSFLYLNGHHLNTKIKNTHVYSPHTVLKKKIWNCKYKVQFIQLDVVLKVLGTYPNAFSQGWLPKYQLPKWQLPKKCNFPSGNFPKFRLRPLRRSRMQWGPSVVARADFKSCRLGSCH